MHGPAASRGPASPRRAIAWRDRPSCRALHPRLRRRKPKEAISAGSRAPRSSLKRSAGGYAGLNDRYVDLRVDDHPAPIEELARLLELHKLYFFAPSPKDVLPIDAVVGHEIVRELVRVGSLENAERYDERAQAALVAFMHVENLENRVRTDGIIDRQTLDYLRNYPSHPEVSKGA